MIINNFEYIFTMSFLMPVDNYIRYLQYKILFRVIATNKPL